MRRGLLGLLFFLFVCSAQAQDPHFSMFNSTPLRLSPAMAGVYEGSFRFSGTYRNQWSSVLGGDAFSTAAASFDMRFFGANRDYFSVGLSAMNDRAGEAQLSQNQLHFNFAYLKQLSGNPRLGFAQYIVAGAQMGFGQQSLAYSDMRFSLQFDGDAFNPDLPTGENFGQNSKTYWDFNVGLMWYALFGERRSIYAGLAAHHLNSPNVSYFDGQSEPLYNKYTIHGGGELPIGGDLSILPGVLGMMQGPSFEVMAGSNFRLIRDDWGDIALRAGVWGRLVGKTEEFASTEALILNVGIEYLSWTILAAYDINTSTYIAATNKRGAFEITLQYVAPPKRKGELVCPSF